MPRRELVRVAVLVALSCVSVTEGAVAAQSPEDPVVYRTAEGTPVAGLRCELGYQEREWHPGEWVKLHGEVRVMAPEGLWLSNQSPDHFATLHLRMPDGRTYDLHWWQHPPRAPKPDALKLLEARSRLGVGHWSYRLARDEVEGVEGKGGKPVRVSLREEGEYQFWFTYSVPRGDGAPRAWAGTATSGTVKVRVSRLPVEKRRRAPTAAQEKMLRDALEVHESATRFDELIGLVSLTENEGLAEHMLQLARQRPEWREHLLSIVGHRAQDGRGRIAIDGPYLAEFVRFIVESLEAGPPKDRGEFPGLDWVNWPVRLVLEYAGLHPEAAPLRDRLVAVLRKNARIENVTPNWGKTPCGLTVGEVWDGLLRAGVLRDGMKLSEAEEVLGRPKRDDSPLTEEPPAEARYVWSYPSQLRSMPASLHALVKDGTVRRFHLQMR